MPKYDVWVRVTDWYKVEGIEAENESAAADIAEQYDSWMPLEEYDQDVIAWMVGEVG